MDTSFLNNVVMTILNEEMLSMRIEKTLFLSHVLKTYGRMDKEKESKQLERISTDHDFRMNLGYKENVLKQTDGTTYYIKEYKPAHIFEKIYAKQFEEKTMLCARLIREILAYAVSITGEDDTVKLT